MTAVHVLPDPGTTLAPAPALIDQLTARARILVAVVFAVAVVINPLPDVALGALGAAVALAFTARLPAWPTARRVLALEGFLALALTSLPFTVPGDTAFTVMGWVASWGGVERAVLIMIKATSVTLAASALLARLDPVVFAHAAEDMGVSPRLTRLHMMTLRYMDVIDREYRRSRLAMRARGFRPGLNVHTWRTLGWLIGMLMVRSVERAERVLAAMRCRGFDPSTSLRSVAAE